ncbi:MAG TPA: hypothetical protein VGP26_31510 [Actinophytocola sp.]|jgi:hypothetical protein|nr:hypothetical protein [Actinophytocola sp.]
MGLTTGFAAAAPPQDNNAPAVTPESRPAPRADVRAMTDRELGSELGRVSGKD